MSKMKLVTFNLRVSVDVDGINCFPHRMGIIYQKIRAERPDIIAFQEVRPDQLECLEMMMPEYTLVGQGREVDYSGEGLYVAVRRESIQLLAFDSFWLSPEPYTPGSRFEHQSQFLRMCNVLRVRRRDTGSVFYVYNLHLDHKSDEAKVDGIQVVLDHLKGMAEKNPHPAVIMGDFNAMPDSEPVKICDSFEAVPMVNVTEDIPCSFHNYGRGAAKIDHIYVTKSFQASVIEVGIWDDAQHGIYLSDHYPICLCME